MTKYEVRTQIYLERKQHKALKRLAEARSTSVAALIRDAVDDYLAEEDRGERINDDIYKHPIFQNLHKIVEELGPSGITDGSVNHDHYLYGWPKDEDIDENSE